MTTTETLARPQAVAATGPVRVLFFGRIADVCGRSLEVALPSEGCSLADLKLRIAAQLEANVAALDEPCIRVAVDQAMAGGDPWVTPGQEVAFLSPFSGG